MAIFLAYLFYFAANTVSPLQRRWLATTREGGGQIDFAFRVFAVVSTLALSLVFFKRPELHGSPTKLILLTLTTGIFGSTFFACHYAAQRHVEAGVVGLLTNIYVPVTIVLSTLFLNESLTSKQFAGTILLLIAMILVSKKHRTGKFSFDRYFWIVMLSGTALAVCITAERALMKTTGFTTAVLLSWWSQVIALGLLTLSFKSHTTYNTKDTLISGSLRFFQGLSWVVLVFLVANLSVVSSVTTFKVVILFIAAAFFLNEKDDFRRKIIGSFLAVAGLLLMI